jgi:DNA mismatch repair protein MutS
MGKRLLRSWMLRPSIDTTEIGARLDAVDALVHDMMLRDDLRQAMEGVLDIERLLSRVTLETAHPRDLLALAASLRRMPGIRSTLSRFAAPRLVTLRDLVDELRDVSDRIESTIIPEPPLTLADGGVMVEDVPAAQPKADWDAVWGRVFLEP